MKRVYNILSIETAEDNNSTSFLMIITPVIYKKIIFGYYPRYSLVENEESKYIVIKDIKKAEPYIKDFINHCKSKDYIILDLQDKKINCRKAVHKDYYNKAESYKTFYVIDDITKLDIKYISSYNKKVAISIANGNYNKFTNTTVIKSNVQRRDDMYLEDICFDDYTLEIKSSGKEDFGDEVEFYINNKKIGCFCKQPTSNEFDISEYYNFYKNIDNEDSLRVVKKGNLDIYKISYYKTSIYATFVFSSYNRNEVYDERKTSVLTGSEFLSEEEINDTYPEIFLSKEELIAKRNEVQSLIEIYKEKLISLEEDEKASIERIQDCRKKVRDICRKYNRMCGVYNFKYITPSEKEW